jgi:hypothetical protein
MKLVTGSLGAHGNPNIPLPDGPPFFQYADPATAAAALGAAGFDPQTSRTETVPLTFELAEVGQRRLTQVDPRFTPD